MICSISASVVHLIPFSTTPTISIQHWTDAFQWASENHNVLEGKQQDTSVFFVTSTQSRDKVSPNLVQKFEREEVRGGHAFAENKNGC